MERLAPGQHFYEAAELAGERLRVPPKWAKVVFPSVGHDNLRMAPVAARAMFDGK